MRFASRTDGWGDAHAGSAGDPPALADGQGWHSRGYVPHFDRAGLVQLITFRLADSLPRGALEASPGTAQSLQRRMRLERLLDNGYGECLLANRRIASLVEDELLHFDAGRYHLLAWVIMPNHVHVLVETLAGHPLSAILHSWKSYTAKAANRMLGRSGPIWQPEYFDRAIRDERHLAAAIEYIHNNPVKAGLAQRAEDWPFSSASNGRLVGGGRVARAPREGRSAGS